MLYLVATPIGNLGDITLRALEILKTSSYILCEDTRHSRPLLHHFAIQTPLKSYHKFNERARLEEVIADIKAGHNVALISDAGTPAISDPGSLLVAACVAENLSVQAIPGPCAAVAALTCSGLATDRFQFYGFLPRKAGELKEALLSILHYPGTTICYESPERLLDVLQLFHSLAPGNKLVIARELTKKFEEVIRGTPEELIQYYQEHPLKGEIVLLVESAAKDSHNWLEMSEEEHVDFLEKSYHLSRKEAIKMAADQRQMPKRVLYNNLLNRL